MFYKLLNKGREAIWGYGSWPDIGEWHSVQGQLYVCENGLHVTNAEFLGIWILHNAIMPDILELYEVEIGEKHFQHGSKWVTNRARLLKKLPFTEEIFLQALSKFFLKLMWELYPSHGMLAEYCLATYHKPNGYSYYRPMRDSPTGYIGSFITSLIQHDMHTAKDVLYELVYNAGAEYSYSELKKAFGPYLLKELERAERTNTL